MKPTTIALACALLLAGCTLGPTIQEFEPAHRAAGAVATVRLARATIAGELLAVSDSGVFLLARDGITEIPFRAIRGGIVRGMPNDFGMGDAPDPNTRRTMRNLSRFPQGLSPELMEKLLAAYRQQATIVLP